jgi:GNAT superfamily N-acetyltransferase
MNLTLARVFAHPEVVTYIVESPAFGHAILRPLTTHDVDALALFLSGLSLQTQRFSIFPSYDRTTAQALCEAINRYDKLRFVLEVLPAPQIAGLFEFSFALPAGDIQRYTSYGVPLDERTDCRFGPTIADSYQNLGIGSRVFPHLKEVAKRFGKGRMILWGGVLRDNARAIRFYEKQGFRRVGAFVDDDGLELLDMILEFTEGES